MLGSFTSVHAASQSPDPPRDVEAGSPSSFDPAVVLATASDEASRQAAARDILKRLGSDATLELPRSWLDAQPASALRLLMENAENQAAIEALATALVRTLRTGENGETTWSFDGLSADARSICLEALSRSMQPSACDALVAWLHASDLEQRQAVARALVGMTGRDDLGASHEGWRTWLDRHKHLPPLAWRSVLAEGLQRRADRLAGRETELLTRLGASVRRLYAALPPAERPAALTGWLADPEPVVRLAATELLSRDLERGVNPPPEVAAALTLLLEDAQGEIRLAAAVLVDRIVPEGSAAKLAVALRKESEPEVANVMLRAFRRFPDAAAIDAVIRWIEYGEPTRSSAMRAILSLLETGFQPSPKQASTILALIAARQDDDLTPAEVRVLARLGGTSGLARVETLLHADRPEIRRAAADALVHRPELVDVLLIAAEADPALLERAADSVAMHKPWASLLRRVAMIELQAPTSASAAEMLPVTAELARLLPMHERLSAAQQLAYRPYAVRAILGQPTRQMFEDGADGDRAYARARFLLGLPDPQEPVEAGADESTPAEAGSPETPDDPPVDEPTDPG